MLSYEEAIAKIRKEDCNIDLCGGRPFTEVIEENLQKGESISVEDLFHVLVNDVRKIYHEDAVTV